MSHFSNKLKELLSVKSVDKLQLSQALGMDRALLYRYMNDQSFPETDFLEELRRELLLTPFEFRELRRSYEMTRLGETVFDNRRIVSGIISSIYRQNERNLGTHNLSPYQNGDLLTEKVVTLTNTDSVYLAISQVFSNPETLEVLMTMQPDHEFVHRSVFSLLVEQARNRPLHIEHIIRLQSKSRDNPATYNLNVFAKIMPPIYACNYYTESRYFVHYYYNNQVAVDERAMELYPNIIVTPWCVCMMSYNYSSAVVVRSRRMAALYRDNFLSVRTKTTCFLREAVDEQGQSTLMARITREPYYEAIFKSHPSISLGVTEEHYIKNYRIESEEDREKARFLLERYQARYASMISDIHKGRRDFFTLSGLRNLIRTGKFSTSRANNMIPMDHAAVKEFLTRYLENVKAHPRFRCHLVKEDMPGRHTGDFGVYLIDNQSMLIEKSHSEMVPKRYIIEVNERSIVDAFSEYLEGGVEFEDYVLSREQTVRFLEDLIGVDLQVDRLSPIF